MALRRFVPQRGRCSIIHCKFVDAPSAAWWGQMVGEAHQADKRSIKKMS